MMRSAAILLALSVAGCGSRPDPLAGLNEQQRRTAGLHAADRAWADSDPCTVRETRMGTEVLFTLPARDCMEFEREEVIRGVWFTGFEESGFIPDVDTVALHREVTSEGGDPEFDIIFEIDGEEALRRIGGSDCGGTCAYALTFVGRRSKPYRNRDGSAGTPVIAVNAVISGRLLGRVTRRVCFRGHPCRYFG